MQANKYGSNVIVQIVTGPDVVGHGEVYKEALIVDEGATRHFLQAMLRAVGQVGVGGQNALLHDVQCPVIPATRCVDGWW